MSDAFVAHVLEPIAGLGCVEAMRILGDPLNLLALAVVLDVVTKLCDDLLSNGAPGLHFYTLNQAGLTTTIWQRLGL